MLNENNAWNNPMDDVNDNTNTDAVPTVEELISQPAQDDTQQSGSYYSPRSGNGSWTPPPADDGGSGDEPPKKRSHKGLKALAVFGCIAFLSYASIKCYQFATENESIRKFFAKDGASSASQIDLKSSAESEKSNVKETATTESSGSPITAQNWIQAAARKDALSIPDIVDKVSPATVGVSSSYVYQTQTYPMWGWGDGQTYEKEVTMTGTGIIMSEEGYIITNAHVIYDNSSDTHLGLAKKVQILLNENYYEGTREDNTLDAEIVGYDVAEDIAVLKVNTDIKLTVAEFGDSSDLRVGELVVAIGNPLGFDYFGSVTTGIVSALDREVTINETTMKLIQTDTAINSGNSGGPLINSYGQVIGINSSKISSNYYSSASVEGLCFAIPMSHAKDVINDLINKGYVSGKPMIGITTVDVKGVGVYVAEVGENSAASRAGIRKGDVIIAVNGQAVTTYDELNRIKDQFKAGDTIKLTVSRGDQDLQIDVVLQEKNQ